MYDKSRNHRTRHASSRLALALLLCAFAVVRGAHAAAAAPLLVGTAWYPEQWPQSRWPKDLELMQAAHLDVVRIGEFAWSTMEPREGEYDFTWLDRAIAAAARHHIYVVIGTPSAAPPAWLTSRYPDTLLVDEDGQRAEHGNRQQFSFSSPRYRALARQVAMRLAERYGHNPDVIGWQIDNEMDRRRSMARRPVSSTPGCNASTAASRASTATGPPPTGARPTTASIRSRCTRTTRIRDCCSISGDS